MSLYAYARRGIQPLTPRSYHTDGSGAVMFNPRWTQRSLSTCAANEPINVECFLRFSVSCACVLRRILAWVSVASHKCLPLDRRVHKHRLERTHTHTQTTLPPPYFPPLHSSPSEFGIVSNGILILRKTFENNYSNGCLPVASCNPTVEALKQTLGGVTPPPFHVWTSMGGRAGT